MAPLPKGAKAKAPAAAAAESVAYEAENKKFAEIWKRWEKSRLKALKDIDALIKEVSHRAARAVQ